MMRQYHSMRQSLPEDVLLLFRLGDFYEMFFEDAKVASSILNLALTKRNGVPMCGVPHHSADGYIARLIKAGKRVALGEQTSEPRPGQIVEREVTQLISAGTISDLNLLDSAKHNYLAAIYFADRKFGLACLDHTTGEFRVTELRDEGAARDELERIAPSEFLFSDEQADRVKAIAEGRAALAYDGYAFLYEQAFYALKEHFGVQSLDGFGCADMPAAVGAAGAIYHYVRHQMRRGVDHIRQLRAYHAEQFVLIDAASQRNLDLVESRAGAKHTLLGALDRTATPMGARKLRDWILHPLRDLARLRARQDAVAAMVEEPFVASQIAEALSPVRDIERTAGRLSQGSGNARDLQALNKSLAQVPEIRGHLAALGESAGPLAASLGTRLRDFTDLVEVLESALADEPPAGLKDGGIFRDGYCGALDELRSASTEGKQWIAALQTREQERTGIRSLKVKYNAVFGYFIEVTKANLAQVPDDYTRKQTTANAERYITPELKEVEGKILGADDRAKNLEYEEFCKLRERVLQDLEAIQDTAAAIAELDVLGALAETARHFNYCRPLLNESRNLYIKDGRHPVLDQNVADEKFVPNDVALEPKENRLLLITGPNMAGKSTYIRQVALLTLMAQIGSFVPAASAEVGLVDRIFTRVGASDDLARGQSTFMVEMNETALIVNNATERSLVILDEIGRGTSTFDGLSIAWSVAEHLHDKTKCRALFATHYHEMCDLARARTAVQNYNVAVREWNDRVIFLRKIIPGTADKSYGIQVARLAGLPPEIISRAKDILSHLEANAAKPKGGDENTAQEKPKRPRGRKNGEAVQEDAAMPEPQPAQLTLF
ncbi:MAG: DNA mismatch repair protein MutS [Verrucomicrobiales bacterium]